MISISFPVAIISVLFRRFLDSFHCNVPNTTAICPNSGSLVLLAGTLYYLYRNLRRGTLVKISNRGDYTHVRRPDVSNKINKLSKHSWFLKNVKGNRSRHTNAIHQVAHQSLEYVSTSNLETSIHVGKVHLKPLSLSTHTKPVNPNVSSTSTTSQLSESFTDPEPGHSEQNILKSTLRSLGAVLNRDQVSIPSKLDYQDRGQFLDEVPTHSDTTDRVFESSTSDSSPIIDLTIDDGSKQERPRPRVRAPSLLNKASGDNIRTLRTRQGKVKLSGSRLKPAARTTRSGKTYALLS